MTLKLEHRERMSEMYFVDREKIEKILQFLNQQIKLLADTREWNTQLQKAALERLTHTIIEAILDVGNAMIDGFIMRDPGSYEDIIDILTDEKVVTEEMGVGLKTLVELRKELVQDYTTVDHELLHREFSKQLPVLKQFTPKVEHYLNTELGPVSAFKR